MRKRRKDVKLVNDFVKKHRDEILEHSARDMGWDPRNLSKDQKKFLIDAFKQDFRERRENIIEASGKWDAQKAKKALNKTLGSSVFTSSERRDMLNLSQALKESGEWDVFRKLNRHQRIDENKLVSVSSNQPNVRKRWVYDGKIQITLYYHEDGSYEFQLVRI